MRKRKREVSAALRTGGAGVSARRRRSDVRARGGLGRRVRERLRVRRVERPDARDIERVCAKMRVVRKSPFIIYTFEAPTGFAIRFASVRPTKRVFFVPYVTIS